MPRNGELDLPDDRIASEEVWTQGGEAMEDAVDAVKGGVRIVIMNPPFTNRSKMGEKFPQETQRALRSRVDDMERILVRSDADMNDFVDKNSLAPLFVALADKCLFASNSTLTMVHPTVALTNPSGRQERAILVQRYYIHSVLTCHQPGQINMSQNTSINESIIVARGYEGERPPTRFINLDRFPADDVEAADLHECLVGCDEGSIANGWGEVSYWPACATCSIRSPTSAAWATASTGMKQRMTTRYRTERPLKFSPRRGNVTVPGAPTLSR